MEKIKLSNYYELSHLVRSEMASLMRIREQYTPPVCVINNLSILCVHLLDPCKEKFPDLMITSGYRCKRLNMQVNGANRSQHTKGQAADIKCHNITELFNFLKKREFDQLILHDSYIHLSYCMLKNRNQIIDQRS